MFHDHLAIYKYNGIKCNYYKGIIEIFLVSVNNAQLFTKFRGGPALQSRIRILPDQVTFCGLNPLFIFMKGHPESLPLFKGYMGQR